MRGKKAISAWCENRNDDCRFLIVSRSRLQIAVQTLWNIKLAVLVKPEHENRISHVGMSSVKTGIANTLGNGSTLYSVFAIPSYVLLPASNVGGNSSDFLS